MKKKIIVIILTVALFFASCGLGVATVFRVEGVSLDTSRISDESDAEAEALRLRLEEIYLNESIFTAKRAQANAVMAEFPYFRIKTFKRAYPDVLVIELIEDEEVFAVETSKGSEEYYILGLDGTVLGVRNSQNNRFDDERNVILKGKDLNVTGEKGSVLTGDDCLPAMLGLCKVLSEKLNGLRGNVLSVEILYRSSKGPVLRFQMQEGVEIIFDAPDILTQEKAETAVEEYFALSDAEKMSGSLLVFDDEQGKVLFSYSADKIVVE